MLACCSGHDNTTQQITYNIMWFNHFIIAACGLCNETSNHGHLEVQEASLPATPRIRTRWEWCDNFKVVWRWCTIYGKTGLGRYHVPIFAYDFAQFAFFVVYMLIFHRCDDRDGDDDSISQSWCHDLATWAFEESQADVNGCHVLMLRWCYNHHIIIRIRMSLNVIVIHTFQSIYLYFLFWRCFKGPRAIWIHMILRPQSNQSSVSPRRVFFVESPKHLGIPTVAWGWRNGFRMAKKRGLFGTASQADRWGT